MNRLNLLFKTTLMLLFFSASTAVNAMGWNRDGGVQPVVGETQGEVTFRLERICIDPVLGPGPGTFSETIGFLKHVGWAALVSDHCALYDPDTGDTLATEGNVWIYHRRGMIEGTYESIQLMPPPPSPPPPTFLDLPPPQIGDLIVQEGVIEVTGGTGRFAELVGGRLPFQVFVTVDEFDGFPFIPDPAVPSVSWSIRWVIAGHIEFAD